VADLMADAATDLFPDRTVSFAVQNYGGLRVNEIGSGPLLVSEMYELMPFDNTLVLVALSGTELTQFVRHMIRSGGWPVSSGVRIAGTAEDPSVTLRGESIIDGATYYVAMPDYVANGGSDSGMLIGKRQLDSGQLIRDVLIDYAAKVSEPIRVTADGRRFSISE
jgi:2',3'-cyclic-nucleotide 2'-phosphodiesterase (5'-nucleotidase family)